MVVVLDPSVRFDEVAAAFADWDGGATDLTPWLGGEPIGARWCRDDAVVEYSANPAIALRVLRGDREAVPAGLPSLDVARARAMAETGHGADALLGVTALGLLGDHASIRPLEELAADSRSDLAESAALALRRIGVALLQVGADRVAARRSAAPGIDPVFGLMGPPPVRRQLIRLFMQSPPDDRRRRVEVVRAAMGDPDWEVRWSAVVAAGLLGLHELARDLRAVETGSDTTREHRQILEALRTTIGTDLVRGAPHPGADHLRACLAGRPDVHDNAFLLIHSLSQPVPDPHVDDAPDGFVAIPPVPHWVGSPDVVGSPVRQLLPTPGLAIARDPVSPVSAAEVSAALDRAASAIGVTARLPGVHELEMAVRGPDGRQFPWGNGRRRPRRDASPWGVRRPLADPEWALDAGGTLVALGGRARSCAEHVVQPARAAVRPVIEQT